jgi:hypothetical protein
MIHSVPFVALYSSIGSSRSFGTHCYRRKQRAASECRLVRMFGPNGHPRNVPVEALRGGRGIALLVLNLGARWGCAVNAMPRPLNPREITQLPTVNGGWVGPRAGLNGCGKKEISWTHRGSNP